MKSLTGKIARLPYDLREQLNRRLRDLEPAAELVPWLNSLPAVQTALAKYFHGQPITPQNLSNWRKTGFQRWSDTQIPLDLFKADSHDARAFFRAARGLASGASAFAAHRLYQSLHPNATEKLSHEEFLKLLPSVNALRKADQQDVHLKLDKRKVRQRDAHLLLQRDIHHRDVVAIALRIRHDDRVALIEAADISNEEKIELVGIHLFGDLWQPRPLPPQDPPNPGTSAPAQPSPRPNNVQPAAKEDPSSKNEDIGQPQPQGPLDAIAHTPAHSSILAHDRSTSPNPQKPSTSLANPQKTPKKSPENMAPSSAVLEPDQGDAFVSPEGCGTLAGDNIPGNPSSLTTRPEGAPEPSPSGPQLPALPPPPSESGPAAPKPLSEGGSSWPQHIGEAVHTHRSHSEGGLAAPKLPSEGGASSQPSTPNPQQYYGPCPAPFTWQGHRPLDPWKVHTS